jgi:serine O-acetyltransferase
MTSAHLLPPDGVRPSLCVDGLERIVDGLMASYCLDGGINHLEEVNLPSQASIEALTHDLKALLFPGFFTSDRVSHLNLRYWVGERVASVLERLTAEAARSLRYAARAPAIINAPPPQAAPDATSPDATSPDAAAVAASLLEALPALRRQLHADAEAALRGDPAARSLAEVLLSYPGMHALTVHRIAHFLHLKGVPLIPRMMSEIVHRQTGIDIHPGASIGNACFIDHGTGVVIGETAIVGDRVKIYQSVTLGALSVPREDVTQARRRKRHPTIEDDVTLYAGATILGGETVIGARSVVGGNVWLTQSVPPDTKVVLEPPQLRFRPARAEAHASTRADTSSSAPHPSPSMNADAPANPALAAG